MLTYVRARLGDRTDRGDVPGWVLVTLMTAMIVAGIWTFAQQALANILTSALCTIGVNGSGASC
jgi:hypothetical protein